MFNISNNQSIKYRKEFTGTKNYEILKCDDISSKDSQLFTYLNVYNNRIIGQFLEKNTLLHQERYMFSFISPKELALFKDKEISFLSIIKYKEIYIQDVHEMFTRTPQFYYYKMKLENIPIFFWPGKSSFFIKKYFDKDY